jgi:hypothetical protein
LSRVIAIEPLRALTATRALAGGLSLTGALSRVVGPPGVEHPPVVKLLTGGIAPVGGLVGAASGPSLVTVAKGLTRHIAPVGSLATAVVVGPPIGVSTQDVGGVIAPAGAVVPVASGPSLVTVLKSLVGGLGLGGLFEGHIDPATVVITKPVGSNLTMHGSVATVVSGPSIETIPKAVAGTITPAGVLTTDTSAPPGTVESQAVDGTITPAGDLATAVSGPSFVTVPQAVDGAITPTGLLTRLIDPSTVKILKDVAGTITPAGARSAIVSGPSFVTKTKNVLGAINPVGALTRLVIPPPVTFFSKDVAGMLTPTGTLSHLVSGPSFVTKPKSVAGILVPSSSLARVVSGPSIVTVPKTTAGTITPVGNINTQITNNPAVLRKTVVGTITPSGARSATVIGGTPVGPNPLYVHMAAWEQAHLDLPPQFASVMFTAFPTTTAGCASFLAAMRARGIKGGFYVGGPAVGDKRPDGSFDFNMSKMQARIDTLAAVSGIASYISDETLAVLVVLDEFHHQKWNGTIPPNVAKQSCAYAKLKLPGIKTALRMTFQNLTGSDLPSGGWGTTLDYGWASYTGPFRSNSAGMTATEFFNEQRVGLAAMSPTVGIICGHNWWNGGDGSSGIEGPQTDETKTFWVASPQEIRNTCDAAIAIPQVKWYGMWTNAMDSGIGGADVMLPIQNRADYQAAFLYVKNAGLARGATPASQYFTDQGFFTAPNPPAIALGKGVRDSLTGHKVFRLVNGARIQDSEYPAFNYDNTLIYYIKAGVGYVADVFWNLPFSDVQVTNERVSVGVSPSPTGQIDGFIWDRLEPKNAYYAALTTPARICQRSFALNTTTVIKNFSNDPGFVNFWSALGITGPRIDGLHANRLQEVFCAIVRNNSTSAPVGVVVWGRLTSFLWNYQSPAGKTIKRVLMDDSGLYFSVQFTDGSWQVGRLESNGLTTLSLIRTGGPTRDDIGALNGSQQAFQGSGIGLRTWDLDPIAASPATQYSHPLRSGKQNLYNQAKASLQNSDRAVYMTYYDDTIRTAWTVHSGATYKLNWVAEQVAATYKLIPEVVRVNGVQYPKVAVPALGGGLQLIPLAGPPVGAGASQGGRTINVTTRAQLDAAMAASLPGDEIVATGFTVSGGFLISRSGTAAKNCVLRGPANFIVEAPGGAPEGHALRLYANFWHLIGFTVRNSFIPMRIKGTDNVVDGLFIHTAQQNILLLRGGAHRNYIQRCTFSNSGLSNAKFAEGIYIGDGTTQTDANNDNKIINCSFVNTVGPIRAEHIDIKKPCLRTWIQGCDMDASGIVPQGGTDVHGAIASQGDTDGVAIGNTIRNLSNSLLTGIVVITSVGFRAAKNNISGSVMRRGLWAASGTGTIFYCDNVVTGGQFSNIACTAVPGGTPGQLQAGQWAYDTATNTLYLRVAGDLNPASQKVVAFDWRFGMEEILLVTTPGVLVGRLCRHFSYVGDASGVDTDACRGGAASYDGSRVAFSTNWGGGTVGIYAVMTDPSA